MRAKKGATRRKDLSRPKKCPVCGSSRVRLVKHKFSCRKCGYKNDLGWGL